MDIPTTFTIPDFGPEETIKVADLKIGDFVSRVPTQANIRGLRVDSCVRTIEDRHGWYIKTGGHSKGMPVPGKLISFQTKRDRSFSWPDSFDVIVRRPIESLRNSNGTLLALPRE
jgi:hypothetical protein